MELPDNEKTTAEDTSLSSELMKESGMSFSQKDTEAEKNSLDTDDGNTGDDTGDDAVAGGVKDEGGEGAEDGDGKKKEGDTSGDDQGSGSGGSQTGDQDDISDDKLLAALNKKTGREYKTLDELRAGAAGDGAPADEEQKKQAAEQTRSLAIEFGKANKLFTQAEYDHYVTFSDKDPADVVQEAFVAKLMKEDPDLLDQDARDLFNEFYHVLEDEDSIKYKQAQKLIAREYEELKKAQFGPILGVTDVYSDVQKHTQRATIYKAEVDKIFDEKIPTKFDFPINGKTYSFAIDMKDKNIAKIVSEIKQDYLTVPMMHSALDQTGKVDEAGLLGMIKKDLQVAVLEKMVTEIATSFSDATLTDAKLGRRGAIDLGQETRSDGKGKLTKPTSESDKLLVEADIGYVPH